jgi:hypothetical protein
MGPDLCANYADRCIEIAAQETDATMRSDLLGQAKAWLQVADELRRNDAFRACADKPGIPEQAAG